MPLNESQNQKGLLSSVFLDTLGSSQFSPAPVAFDAIEAVMIKYGKLFAEGFSKELDNQDINAGGGLDSSIRFEFSKPTGNSYVVSIFMADYAKFVDEGVQGINPGKSINQTSPYIFNLAYPSAKHVAQIERWIKEKNVTAIITVPKGISHLTKQKSLSQSLGRSVKDSKLSDVTGQKSLAYAIATNIKQKGIRATNFKQNVIDKLKDEFRAEIMTAARKDISINIVSL